MEIKFNGNTISIINATRQELSQVSQFIFGENVPYNAFAKIEMTTPSLNEIKEVTEASTTLNEIKDDTEENDMYVNPVELAKEMGVCPQCIDYHLKKKVNPLPISKKIGKVRMILRSDAEKYFAENPIDKEKNTKTTVTTDEFKDLITMGELARLTNRTPSTLQWHINKGMPVAAKDKNGKRYFKLADVTKYLEEHLNEKIHETRTSVTNNIKPFPLWQTEMFSKIDIAKLDRGKTCSDIFRKIKRVYGVDLDTEKRNFYKDKGHYPKSTLETCFYVQYEQKHKDNEHYEHLFENELDKLVNA